MIRRTVFHMLDADSEGKPLDRAVNLALNVVILANVAAVILGTVQSIEDRYGEYLAEFEAVSLTVFTVEYLLRLWTCTLKPRYAHPVYGRIRYVLSPMALIDLGSFIGSTCRSTRPTSVTCGSSGWCACSASSSSRATRERSSRSAA